MLNQRRGQRVAAGTARPAGGPGPGARPGPADRRRPAPPPRAARAGSASSHDTIRGPVGTPCRGTSSLTGRSAMTRSSSPVGRPHLDAAGKVRERHPERERPLQPVHEQVLRRPGIPQAAVQAARTQLRRPRPTPGRPGAAPWWPAPRRRRRRRRYAAGPGTSPSASASRPSPRAAARSARAGRSGARAGRTEREQRQPRPWTSGPPRRPRSGRRRGRRAPAGPAPARPSPPRHRPPRPPMPSRSSTVNANRRPSGAHDGHARACARGQLERPARGRPTRAARTGRSPGGRAGGRRWPGRSGSRPATGTAGPAARPADETS